jgi:hypothetical protein
MDSGFTRALTEAGNTESVSELPTRTPPRFLLVLLLLAVAIPAVCSAGFTPRWQVGDWWETRSTVFKGKVGWRIAYPYRRYNIIRMAVVDGCSCYVLQVEYRRHRSEKGVSREEYYVRADGWIVVRQVILGRGRRGFETHLTWNFPGGQRGPNETSLCLPSFPLGEAVSTDSIPLPPHENDNSTRYLLVRTGTAESAVAASCLVAGDTQDEPVLRPSRGAVYSYWLESDCAPVQAGAGQRQRMEYSIQLWCKSQPWRLYDEREFSLYHRRVLSQSWLIASGHASK